MKKKKKTLSRQRIWQIEQTAIGNCAQCGKYANGLRICDDCYEKVRVRLGTKRRNLNSYRYRDAAVRVLP